MCVEIGRFTVTQIDDVGTGLIALEGEHDIATMRELARAIECVYPDCARAVVDLSRATFIDCSVIGWLLSAHRRLGANARRFACVLGRQPASVVQRLVEIVDLPRSVACYPTQGEAVSFLRPGHVERPAASASATPAAC